MNPAFATTLAPVYDALADDMVHAEALTGVQTPVRGIYTAPGETILDGVAMTTLATVRYTVASWPAVVRGDGIRLDGVDYTVREDPRSLLDGLEAVIPLERAA